MKVIDQLRSLVRLQDLVLEIRNSQQVVEQAPAKIEEIEGAFRERNAEYVAVKERFDALETDQKARSTELTELEANRKKYMDDLMNVQNQREYAAMLREIDTVKAHIAEHEEAILRDMEEIETVKSELSDHESHIQEERRRVQKEHADVEAGAEDARKLIVKQQGERKAIEDALPKNLVFIVHRLEGGRQGQFLSKAEDGVCQSCYVRMRPQVFQEIKLSVKVHACGNCKRLLYHAPSLAVESADTSAESPSSESGPGGIGAGAV